MNRLKILLILLIFQSDAFSQKLEQYVFKLRPEMCTCEENSKNKARTLIGFKVKDSIGIFTALHGISDCKYINIIDYEDKVYKYFELAFVDIKNDIAYLKPSSTVNISKKNEKIYYQRKYEGKGFKFYYPDTIEGLKSAIIRFYANNTKFTHKYINILNTDTFCNFISPKYDNPNYSALKESFLIYKERGSPNIKTIIAIIDDIVAHGNSGAPIVKVYEDEKRKKPTAYVFGMFDGGFESDRLSWCIPFAFVNLVSVNNSKDLIKQINSKCPPSELFSYENSINENKIYRTNELDKGLRIITNKSYSNQDLIDIIYMVHNKKKFIKNCPVSYGCTTNLTSSHIFY